MKYCRLKPEVIEELKELLYIICTFLAFLVVMGIIGVFGEFFGFGTIPIDTEMQWIEYTVTTIARGCAGTLIFLTTGITLTVFGVFCVNLYSSVKNMFGCAENDVPHINKD